MDQYLAEEVMGMIYATGKVTRNNASQEEDCIDDIVTHIPYWLKHGFIKIKWYVHRQTRTPTHLPTTQAEKRY